MKEKNIPLLLETHFFTKVNVEVNPRFNPEKEGNYEIKTNVEIGQHRDEPRRWQVILKLDTQPRANLPYKIKLQCAGLFKVSPKVEKEKMGQLVRANGTAILYSSAREFLLLITGRGPWDAFYLPTTNFLAPPKPKKTKAIRKKLSNSTDTSQTKSV